MASKKDELLSIAHEIACSAINIIESLGGSALFIKDIGPIQHVLYSPKTSTFTQTVHDLAVALIKSTREGTPLPNVPVYESFEHRTVH